jgi:hypothetical protein
MDLVSNLLIKLPVERHGGIVAERLELHPAIAYHIGWGKKGVVGQFENEN